MCREENLISIVFSTIEEFAPQRNGLLTLMCSMCGSQRGMRLFVAVNEAVNNALFHANRDLPEACVELVAVDEGASLRISVRSEGDGFEHDLRADPGVFSDFLRESGRGVQIILHVVDEVSIEESGSIVTLRMGKDDSQRRNSSIPS
jgi:serine/threonine-protein kinase RsbW